MFAPYCERHGSRVLLSTSDIVAISHDDRGLFAEFVCTCGYHGTWRPAAG